MLSIGFDNFIGLRVGALSAWISLKHQDQQLPGNN